MNKQEADIARLKVCVNQYARDLKALEIEIVGVERQLAHLADLRRRAGELREFKARAQGELDKLLAGRLAAREDALAETEGEKK